jgi:hypothetical protein
MTETKIAYAVYSNTDLNEGRGKEIRLGICESRTTAARLSRRRGVQGTDAIIREIKVTHFDEDLYFSPKDLFKLIPPTAEDGRVADIEAKNLAYISTVKKP